MSREMADPDGAVPVKRDAIGSAMMRGGDHGFQCRLPDGRALKIHNPADTAHRLIIIAPNVRNLPFFNTMRQFYERGRQRSPNSCTAARGIRSRPDCRAPADHGVEGDIQPATVLCR